MQEELFGIEMYWIAMAIGTALVVSTLITLGLSLSFSELRDARKLPVGRALALNLIVIPAVAVIIVRGLALDPEIALGILLIGVAPIMPLFTVFTSFARSRLPGSHGPILYASLLMVISIPITLLLFRLGLIIPSMELNLIPMFLFLVGFQTIPIVIGFFIHERFARRAALARKIAMGCAIATLMVFIAISQIVSRKPLATLYGSGTLLASILLVVTSLVLGWLVGGPDPKIRKNLAMGTSLRNVGLSLFFAWAFFPDTLASEAVSVYAIFMLIFNILVAYTWRRQAERQSTTQAG
jgi:BASS family bile acid:Na+ symporter